MYHIIQVRAIVVILGFTEKIKIFRISSPTRNAEISSAKTLKLNSGGGEVSIEALNDLKFDASKVKSDLIENLNKLIFMQKIIGIFNYSHYPFLLIFQISFNSNDIYIPNVFGEQNKRSLGRITQQNRSYQSYEICVCGNNKKVFASSDGCLTPVRMDQNGKSIEEVCSQK